MDILKIREYCLSKPFTAEEFPFDEVTLVFKVYGRIFALVKLEAFPLKMNLKCDPAKAISLREQFDFVAPGYHMNKKHWNTITLGDKLSEGLLFEMIDHSFDQVVRKLPRRVQQQIYEQVSQ